MSQTIAQKLRIKEGMTLLSLYAPENFNEHLQPLPNKVVVSSTTKKFNQVHWFVINKAALLKDLDKIITIVKDDVICWIYYPKGTSNIQTDLTRDKGWDTLLSHKEMQWISLISFDDTWSAFGFRLKTAADIKKHANPKVREIFNYIDAEKKIIHLPDELASTLKQNKSANTFYQTLSFSNKKEYVEWIVTAKRDETRRQRIEGTIERLLKGWKNPQNR